MELNAVNVWVNSGPLYSQDRILQAMGNITLAFHLLCERADPNSFWQPYIQTLPSEYDTPLYFEEDEVRDLQSTQAIHDVFSQYKNTARQYAYFYKVIQVSGWLPLKCTLKSEKEREIDSGSVYFTFYYGCLNIARFKLKGVTILVHCLSLFRISLKYGLSGSDFISGRCGYKQCLFLNQESHQTFLKRRGYSGTLEALKCI